VAASSTEQAGYSVELEVEDSELKKSSGFLAEILAEAEGDADEFAELLIERRDVWVNHVMTISVSHVDVDGGSWYFQLHRKRRFGRLFRLYCQHAGVALADCRFYYMGNRLSDEDTAGNYLMKEGDVIQVSISS